MATSGSRNYVITRDNIIEFALRTIGVLGLGDSATTAMKSEAADALNIMVLSWQNDGVFLWTQADDVQIYTAATANYTLDSDILEVKNVFWRHDGIDMPLKALTREEYKNIADKDTAGTPTSYLIDYQLAAPVLYTWPVYAYTTSLVTGTDANTYLAKLDHTSASATYPITGASYATYWESSTETTGGAWVTATAYYSGHVRYTKVYRLQDFDSASDNPDFPVRWYKALVYGLAVELAPQWGKIGEVDFKTLGMIAEREKIRALNANNESADLSVRPRRR